MIEIIPADDHRLFKEFLDIPFRLHASDPSWVPPLIRDIKKQFSPENPFFRHAEVRPFIARKSGKTSGRITAIYNQAYLDYYNESTGFFGFFDCIDDQEIAGKLLSAVRGWLKQKGMVRIQGPMNFSSNEEWGLLIEGFDSPPMIMMPYNPQYYRRLLESNSLSKAKDLFAYIADVPKELPEKVYRVSRVAEKQGISARPMRLRDIKQEMMIFKEVYHSAWKKNWGFIPMTDEEIEYTAKKLRPVIVPELALIAECKGMPVGFMMMLPDFNQVLNHLNGRLLPFGFIKALWYAKRIKDARLLLLGVKQGFRRRGVDSLLFIEAMKALKKTGYRRLECSWVLEDNYAVQRIIETMNGRIYKKYRVYEGDVAV